MATIKNFYIAKAYDLIVDVLEDEYMREDLIISWETICEINSILRRSSLFPKKNYRKLIKYIKEDYPNKIVSYSYNKIGKFWELDFMALRHK